MCQLWIKRGEKETAFQFFVTSLGEDRIIFGYPWFEHENPEIDWKAQELKGGPVIILTGGYCFRRKRHQEAKVAVMATFDPVKETPIPEEYQQHQKVFSDEEAQRFPPEREEDFPIKLRPDAPQKINCKIYPLTPKEDESLKAYIEENLAKGYIYEGSSPYASSFFFRKKTNGGLRPIIDYRPLNAWTIKDTYPLPLISDILTNLSGKKVFSKFDIRWGYHNIRIREEDQLKAAFKTPRGLFIPRVMTFGLTNAPATFARTMSRILRPLMDAHPKELFVYMDDVLIATEEDLPRHRKIVHAFLEICEDESYFLKASKCVFEQNKISYLGIVIDGSQIKIDPRKVEGIKDWPREVKTLKGVRSVLGTLSYQRPFIPFFAHHAKPITDTIKTTDGPFKWTKEAGEALEKLITLICEDPVLCQPNMDKPFELEVDASAFAIGAILTQRDTRGKPQAVGYFSKAFTTAERNYDIHDRELLAVLWGLEHWRHLLMGSPHKIKVFTDHKNLEYYRHPQRINRRVARYIPRLADYHYQLIHKPGTQNHADALSRRPDHMNEEEDNTNVTVLTPEVFANAALSIRIDDRVMAQQLLHQDTLNEWATPYQLVKSGKYWWKDTKLVVVDNTVLRRGVISLYHNLKTAGHPGIMKMIWLVSQDFWWPDMKLDISAYVQGCATCQANKNFPGNPKPPLFPIKTKENALPFETITLDFITKLPESDGYDTILTIVDHDCFKAAFFIPCKETIDTKGVAALLGKTLFPHYGLPRRVISDRDTRFTAKLTKEWCDTLDIEQNISTAYHPQTDGQSERANRWVEQYLRMFINHQQNNWADLLPLAQYTHNSWPSATTKKTPYELILGYTPKMHQPQRTGNMPETKERLEQILEARRAAQAAITHAQSQYKDSPHFQPYSEGDKVWLDARNLKTTHPTFKLAPKRYGPFPITRKISAMTYALRLPPQWRIHPVFHASLLMPYKETPIHGTNFPEPPPDLIEGEPEWEVDQIMNTRQYRNQTQFLIKWKGYSDAHNSWEPEKNLSATELVEKYYKRNPRSVGAEEWIK